MKGILNIRRVVLLLFLLSVSLNLIACGDDDEGVTPTDTTPPPNVLVSQTVTVGGEGGWAAVSFDASNGQRIRITLSSTDTCMEPYGSLEYPDGSSDYYPPCEAAQNGYNSIELLLNQTGRYTLTIFDGANLGGTVTVRVEVI